MKNWIVGVALGLVTLVLMIPASPACATETVTYQYDALGRLKQSAKSGGPEAGVQTTTSFDPAGNRTNQTTTGVTTPGLVTFSVANAPTVNGGSPLIFTVTKTGTASTALTVNYSTSNGTASAGTDYVATSGALNFAVGDTSKTVSVTTLNPATAGTRTVLMSLSGASAGAAISTAQANGSVNYVGASGPIVLTDNTFTVLPAHSSLYYCANGGGAVNCILSTTNVAVLMMYQGHISSIKTGYSINWLGELEVEAAYYGTSN